MCGAVVMAYEIIGSRMLGPYVGTSYFVWTAIIGIILFSLSIGYYLGGWLSDRQPKPALLSMIILLAALYILITVFIKDPLLSLMIDTIRNLHWISVLSSIVLFTIPSMLLGMVSPFAAKLKMYSVVASGRTVGNLYALSTIGSIVGVFLAGFYLIPSYGISTILIIFSIILMTISLFLMLIYRFFLKQSSDEKN